LGIKPIEEYHWRSKTKGTKKVWCKTCVKLYDQQRQATDEYKADKCQKQAVTRRRNRKFVCDFLQDKECIDCGEKRVPCLQFDHQDEVDKSFNISNMSTRSIATIKKEIAKCEIRCANCHSIRTAQQQGWYYVDD